MSASNKKKLRKEQNAAILTEKQRKEQAEAKKLKVTTGIFVGIIGLVLCAFVVMIAVNLITTNGLFEKATTAATFDGEKINSVEMNYYYIDAVQQEYSNINSQYGDYAASMLSMMGWDTTKPLNEQVYDKESGETWADYFLTAAKENAQRDYALAKAAKAAGYTLSDEDKTSLENISANLATYAYLYGYTSANSYLRANYGNGADEKSYVAYLERSMIAEGYYSQYSDGLTYDNAAIRAQDEKNPLNYNAYDYSYYYVKQSSYLEGGTKNDAGTVEYSEDEKAAALAKAKEIADQLAASADKAALKAAVEALEVGGKKEETLTESTNTLYTNVSALYNEWLSDSERKAGDITVVANESTTGEGDEAVTVVNGYYVVCFDGMTTNDLTNMVSVRHLLVAFPEEKESTTEENHDHAEEATTQATTEAATEATTEAVTEAATEATTEAATEAVTEATTEATEAATEPTTEATEPKAAEADDDKAATLAEAEALLKQWQEGDATEDSFAALVKEKTDDTASAETGGLYEHLHAGASYVPEFLNWAIDASREVGDVEIVETEYGYHIMYFVGEEDMNYRDYMISEELRAADLESWFKGLTDATPLTLGETKYLSKDLVLG